MPAKSWEINSLRLANQFIETIRDIPQIMEKGYVSEDFDFERHESVWKNLSPRFGQGYPAVDFVVEKSCYGLSVTEEEIREAEKELEDD